jgi:hypothetical protein
MCFGNGLVEKTFSLQNKWIYSFRFEMNIAEFWINYIVHLALKRLLLPVQTNSPEVYIAPLNILERHV